MRVFVTRSLNRKEQETVEKSVSEVYSSEPCLLQSRLCFEIPELSPAEKKSVNEKCISALSDFTCYLKSVGFDLKLYQYQKFRLYFELRNLIYEFEKLKKLEPKAGEVIFSSFGLLTHLFSGVKVLTSKSRFDVGTILKFLLIVGVRLVKSIFQVNPKANVCFLDCREYYQKILLKDGSERKFQNTHLEYLYNEFGYDEALYIDRFNYPNFKKKNEFRSIMSYVRNYGARRRIFEEKIIVPYWVFKRGEVGRLKESIVKSFEVINSAVDPESWNSILGALFRNLISSTIFFSIKEAAYKDFFSKFDFSKLVLADEYSANNRVVMNAAQVYAVKVVGVQHGSIHSLHPGYVFDSQEQTFEYSYPDCFGVWGSKWKELLLSLGWPEDRVEVVGHLRTDVIPALVCSKNKPSDILDSLDNSKSIVVFASQPQRDEALRKRVALDAFSMAKRLEGEVQLVVKTHPREVNSDIYDHWAQEIGCENFRIVSDVDLYKLLSITDILITSFSTVGTEAIYFSIPLVIIDPLDQDVMNFYKDGVAYKTRNSDELIDAVGKIKTGQWKPPSSVLAGFVKRNANKIDGKTSLRYRMLIASH